MKVLVLCHHHPNYVPDLLLHGLRKLLGDDVVDVPRKDILYRGLCGQYHLDPVPDLLPPDSGIDRTDIVGKVKARHFDLVLCDVRALDEQRELLQANPRPLAVIDGEDGRSPIPAGPYAVLRRETDGSDSSIPLPMAMPSEVLDWIDRHADAPKTHSIGFLGSRSDQTPDRYGLLDELARRFPDALIGAWEMKAGNWRGRDAYYAGLQSCRAVLTLPGVGNDTFRYWEHAACNAAHVAKRMPLLIPNDFRESSEILRFSDLDELVRVVERVLGDEEQWPYYAYRSRSWLRAHHTTERRAQQTLDRLTAAFQLA